MKRKNIIIVGTVVLIWAGITGFIIINSDNKGIEKNNVSIERYSIPKAKNTIINGIIEPNQSKTYYKDLSKGNSLTINVGNGDYVNKGDLIITYRNDDVTNQIKSLEEQVQDLKNKKNKSQDEIEKSAIEEQINQSSNDIKKAKKKEYSYVYAQFSGNVYINDSSKDEENQEILTINSTDLYVKAQCTEKEHPNLSTNLSAEVLILPTNKKANGKIRYISALPKDQNISGDITSEISHYDVEITLENQEDLFNGYHVQASINLKSQNIEIPKSSIIKESDEYYVYTIKNDVLTKQIVVVSGTNGENMIVSSGLSENDEIIKNPTPDMKEGQTIE